MLTDAEFSPDGTRIITASQDETARLWDAASGRPIGEPLKGHTDIASSAAFSPDGKQRHACLKSLSTVSVVPDRIATAWGATCNGASDPALA
jgi:WD40 repeat protein